MTAAEVDPVFVSAGENRVEAQRGIGECFKHPGLGRGGFDGTTVGRVKGGPHGDVVGGAELVAHKVLENDRQRAAPLREFDLRDVHAIHVDASGSGLIQTRKQLHEGGLTRAIDAHNGRGSAGLDGEVEPREDCLVGPRVAEVQVSELNRGARCAGGHRGVAAGRVVGFHHGTLHVTDSRKRVHAELGGWIGLGIVAPQHERTNKCLQPQRECGERHGANGELPWRISRARCGGGKRVQGPHDRRKGNCRIHEVGLEVDAASFAVNGVRKIMVRLLVPCRDPRHRTKDSQLLGGE